MQHADTFKHPMRTGDDVTVVDMRHLGRTKRQLIVDKGASSQPAVAQFRPCKLLRPLLQKCSGYTSQGLTSFC